MSSENALPHSVLPFQIQPCMADHGKTTLIVDAEGFVVAKIPSAVWNEKATLKYPIDRGNAALILKAVNVFYPMRAAFRELQDLLLAARCACQESPQMLGVRQAELDSIFNEASQLFRDLPQWDD